MHDADTPTAEPAPATLTASPRQLRALVLGGLVLTVLTYLVLGGYLLSHSHDQHEERAELLAQSLADSTERLLTANVEKIDLALNSIVDELEHQLSDQHKPLPDSVRALDLARVDQHVRSQIDRRPELENLRITNAAGLGIAGPGLTGRTPPVDFSDRQWFIRQRDEASLGMFMSRPIVSKIDQKWILSFSRRYNWPDGSFAGCVTASVPLAWFDRLLATGAGSLGPNGAVVLRNNELELLARFPRAEGQANLRVLTTKVSPQLRALVTSGAPSGVYRTPATADGVPRTTAIRRLSSVPLVVSVGLAPVDYLADWSQEVRQIAGLCAGVTVLNIGAALLLLHVLRQNRQARQRIDLLAKVFEHSGESILVTDADNHIVEVNPAFERQTGYAAAEVLGRDPRLLAAGRTTADEYRAMWAAIQSEGRWRGELWDRHKDGHVYPKWMSISALRDDAGRLTHHIGSFVDISEIKQAEERILHLAQHDLLTRLPNRAHLDERLARLMADARRAGEKLAVLFVDLDRFKSINDMLGHHVGDGLLVEVAQRLRAAVHPADIVARLGGDEFALVLSGVGQQAEAVARKVADRLLETLSHPYRIGGHELHSTPSIGVALFPADGDDPDTLMKHADAAMYHAKSNGRNNAQFFVPAMNAANAERAAIEAGLRHAAERGELQLHYQPQVELHTGNVVGTEALLRWNSPELGNVPPLRFIPVAEETGQIDELGAWVLDAALAQVARWRADGLPGLRVAVNLSARQLQGDDFVPRVDEALRRHHLPGDALELEVTESAAMRDPTRTIEQLHRLRALGVALAIDDFGTGYSSLSYLKQLPISCLKLDRSFVMDIEHDPNDAAISAATIQLAHNLGLAVVAEGVETVAQLDFLRGLDCDVVQGYHIGKPMPAEACTRFLQSARDNLAPAEVADAPVVA